MLTEEFSYVLDEQLIARYPTVERTASRLLCLDRASGQVVDRQFGQILELMQPGDLLVLNNSRVLQARLFGQKQSGGRIEMLVERIINTHQAWAHIRASKSPKAGCELQFNDGVTAQVLRFDPVRSLYLVEFNAAQSGILIILEQQGEIPLPPYFNRAAENSDLERYQTVYAKHLGSVAAPTAGLHFSAELLAALDAKGVAIGHVTLHVGAGTFQPVRVKNLAEHKMHSEFMQVSTELCAQIAATKAHGKRVICVGTTSVRALESAALPGKLMPYSGETDIFITPGFKFKVVDALLTNFHLPESTLLMLVSAFAGKESILAAYQHAIEHKYRFYSYGDAMFIS